MGHGEVDGRDDEMLDVVDPTGEPIAMRSRSSVHSEGHWHQVFHCLVARSGLPARVLLQRRRHSSRAFPGLLDLSVTGHLRAGERPVDGIRELREEMGLTIDPARLVRLGRRLLADDRGEGLNREIAHVYLLTDDTPLEQLQLDFDEVAGFVEVAVLDVLAMLDDPTVEVSAVEVDTARQVRLVRCTGAELVPAVDGYWVVLAIMVERHLAGGHPIGI